MVQTIMETRGPEKTEHIECIPLKNNKLGSIGVLVYQLVGILGVWRWGVGSICFGWWWQKMWLSLAWSFYGDTSCSQYQFQLYGNTARTCRMSPCTNYCSKTLAVRERWTDMGGRALEGHYFLINDHWSLGQTSGCLFPLLKKSIIFWCMNGLWWPLT